MRQAAACLYGGECGSAGKQGSCSRVLLENRQDDDSNKGSCLACSKAIPFEMGKCVGDPSARCLFSKSELVIHVQYSQKQVIVQCRMQRRWHACCKSGVKSAGLIGLKGCLGKLKGVQAHLKQLKHGRGVASCYIPQRNSPQLTDTQETIRFSLIRNKAESRRAHWRIPLLLGLVKCAAAVFAELYQVSALLSGMQDSQASWTSLAASFALFAASAAAVAAACKATTFRETGKRLRCMHSSNKKQQCQGQSDASQVSGSSWSKRISLLRIMNQCYLSGTNCKHLGYRFLMRSIPRAQPLHGKLRQTAHL